ncbi:S-adenosyl-L-methionine-dependent methyltransferase [Stachybotrys elegans]|uniref:S-adenosyl-L-methionine-dependent methyltransferase n=1 Tax=Stachybotrys elegans TaxID=80388 RepID=A0A8K0SZB2_9HYPO|nr:S-adenosyl-L-methionine-dependent methyltransferase [Stachybotrys elegans]
MKTGLEFIIMGKWGEGPGHKVRKVRTGGHLDQTLIELLQLSGLIQTSIANYVAAKTAKTPKVEEGILPSVPLFEAQRTLLSAAGKLTELVMEPQSRIIEVSLQQFEARSLHLAAGLRIADIIAEHGEDGLAITEISAQVGVESRKLSRVMRCLCSIHIFSEIADDVFANNIISKSLIGNDPLRAYVLSMGQDVYTASDYMLRWLLHPEKGPDYSVEVTPFQDAVDTTTTRWTWLEEKAKVNDILAGRNGPGGSRSAYPGVYGTEYKDLIALAEAGRGDEEVVRPEHNLFGLAMVGGGRVYAQAHLYDFPWQSLGNATVVDIGGGMGGFCLQLSRIYPNLNFVLQDRGPVLALSEANLWPRENPQALADGRIKFVEHDFFNANPIKEADVYWLRYVIHDWSDDYCITILKNIRVSMGPQSRILVCDQVMNTTNGDVQLPSAPAPLPANYGYYTRYSHTRDLCVMALINGIERKPTEFRDIVKKAGLHLNKFYQTRSQVGLVEIVLPNSPLRER